MNNDITESMLGAAIMALMLFLTGLFMDEAEGQTIPQMERIIIQSARQYGINPALALAIADVESEMNPNMVGSIGEIGLFQLRPEYHRVVRGDIRQNVTVAIKYLAELKRRCSTYGEAYFVCYNYGPTRRLKHPTRFPYYKKVMIALKKRQAPTFVARNEK